MNEDSLLSRGERNSGGANNQRSQQQPQIGAATFFKGTARSAAPSPTPNHSPEVRFNTEVTTVQPPGGLPPVATSSTLQPIRYSTTTGSGLEEGGNGSTANNHRLSRRLPTDIVLVSNAQSLSLPTSPAAAGISPSGRYVGDAFAAGDRLPANTSPLPTTDSSTNTSYGGTSSRHLMADDVYKGDGGGDRDEAGGGSSSRYFREKQTRQSLMAVDGMTISFRDVVMVKPKTTLLQFLQVFKGDIKQELSVQQACGYFEAGTLNVIGSSQADNANALLDVLCGRRLPMTGTVLANGLPVAASTFRRIVGFVGLTRAAIDTLTVGQNITFSAAMRSASFHDKKSENGAVCRDNVDIVMTMMGFDPRTAVDTLNEIGKVKLELAMELVLDPPVIFLRQPLAELPSHQIAELVELLLRVARILRKTVIMTSTSFPMPLWERLDNCVVLGLHGHTMFSGPRERLTPYFLTLKLSPYCLSLSHDHMDRASRTSLGFSNLWANQPGSLVNPWNNNNHRGSNHMRRQATDTSAGGASSVDGEDADGGDGVGGSDGASGCSGRASRQGSEALSHQQSVSFSEQQQRRSGSPLSPVSVIPVNGISFRSSSSNNNNVNYNNNNNNRSSGSGGAGRNNSNDVISHFPPVNSILTPKHRAVESPVIPISSLLPTSSANARRFHTSGGPPPPPNQFSSLYEQQRKAPSSPKLPPVTATRSSAEQEEQGLHRDSQRWLVVSDGDVAMDVTELWADREEKESATTRYAAAFYDSKDRNTLMSKLEDNQRMGASSAFALEYDDSGCGVDSPTTAARELRQKTESFNFTQMLHQPPGTIDRLRALVTMLARRGTKNKDLLLATLTLFLLFAFAAWVMHRQNSDQQGMQNTRGIIFFMFWVCLELNIYFIQGLVDDVDLFLHHRDGGYYNLRLFLGTLFLRLVVQRIIMLVPLTIFIFWILSSLNALMWLVGLCSLAHISLLLFLVSITQSTTATTFMCFVVDAYMVIFSGFLYNLNTLPVAITKTSLIRFGYGGAVHHDLRDKPWACDQNKFAPGIANLTTNQTSYCYTGDQYIASQGFQDDSLNSNSVQLAVIILVLLVLSAIRLSILRPM